MRRTIRRAKSQRAKSQRAKSLRAKSLRVKSQCGGGEPKKKASTQVYSQIAKNPDILPGVVLTAAAFVTGPVWMCTLAGTGVALGTLGLATNKLRHQYKKW